MPSYLQDSIAVAFSTLLKRPLIITFVLRKGISNMKVTQQIHGWHSEILKKRKKARVQGPPRPWRGAGAAPLLGGSGGQRPPGRKCNKTGNMAFKIKYAQMYLRRRRALPLSSKRSVTSGRCLLQWIPRYITDLTRIFRTLKKCWGSNFQKTDFPSKFFFKKRNSVT